MNFSWFVLFSVSGCLRFTSLSHASSFVLGSFVSVLSYHVSLPVLFCQLSFVPCVRFSSASLLFPAAAITFFCSPVWIKSLSFPISLSVHYLTLPVMFLVVLCSCFYGSSWILSSAGFCYPFNKAQNDRKETKSSHKGTKRLIMTTEKLRLAAKCWLSFLSCCLTSDMRHGYFPLLWVGGAE